MRAPIDSWTNLVVWNHITQEALHYAASKDVDWCQAAAVGLLARLGSTTESKEALYDKALHGQRSSLTETLMQWARDLPRETVLGLVGHAAVWAGRLAQMAEEVQTAQDRLLWCRSRDDGASVWWLIWASGHTDLLAKMNQELNTLDYSARNHLQGPVVWDARLNDAWVDDPGAWWAPEYTRLLGQIK